MSKKGPPQRDVERIRRQLSAEPSGAAGSADLEWARRVLAGEKAPPPGAALRPEVAYALVEELHDRQDADPLAHLATLADRTLAKAARTALHRLRSHGLDVTVPAEADEAHAGTGQSIQHDLPSVLSVYDGLWERLVWVGDDAPTGVRVYQARVSAMYGLVDIKVGRSPRREFRAQVRDILQELGGRAVTRDQALWFIHDAVRRSRERQRSLPRGFAAASQSLGPPPSTPHPLLVLPASTVDDHRMKSLFDLPELKLWLPDREFLQRLGLKLDEVLTSRLVISEAQRQERLAAVIDQALEEFFTPERCRACRTVLLDVGHLLLLVDRGTEATAARAAAEVFAAPAEEVVRHPFARHFLERVLRIPQGPKREEAEPAGGGLILP